MGADGEPKAGSKHPFELKEQWCAFRKLRELMQSTREAQTAVRSSFAPIRIQRAVVCLQKVT